MKKTKTRRVWSIGENGIIRYRYSNYLVLPSAKVEEQDRSVGNVLKLGVRRGWGNPITHIGTKALKSLNLARLRDEEGIKLLVVMHRVPISLQDGICQMCIWQDNQGRRTSQPLEHRHLSNFDNSIGFVFTKRIRKRL